MRRLLALAFVAATWPIPTRAAPPTWPTTRLVWSESFDAGLPDGWEDYGDGAISVAAGAVTVSVSGAEQRYLQLYNLTPWPHLEFPRDTYVSVSVDVSGVTLPAGVSLALVRLRDAEWNVMAGLRLRGAAGGGIEAALELPDGSAGTVAAPLAAGPHVLVLGVRPHDWAGLWVDDAEVEIAAGLSHAADFVTVLLLGKADGVWSGPTPSGSLRVDGVDLRFAAYPDLYVAPDGDDASEGSDAAAPLATLGLAALLSAPGTTIHVAPGDYRESVVQPTDGTAAAPIRYLASGGRGSARILGSRPAADAAWTRLTAPGEIPLPAGVDLATATIWRADLASWALDHAPLFVVAGATRLPWAREPDLRVDTPWRHHEYWWEAEGGDAVTTCDPAAAPDCDEPDRSDRWLIDEHDDDAPAGIEPGSLASLGDVSGAIIHVKDNWSGHYTFRRRIAEVAAPGRVRLEKLPEGYTEGCWFDHDPANPALGWGSKYYLEGLAGFLDQPGEWYYDAASGALYLWTSGPSPAELGVEISTRAVGFDLSGRSAVELRDLDLAFFEEDAVRVSNSDTAGERSYDLVLAGLDVGFCTRGLTLAQAPRLGSPVGSQIRRFTLRDSVLHDIDSLAIFTWTGRNDDWVRAGITDLRVFHNEFVRVGFHDNEQGGGGGVSFQRLDHLLFEGNWVHHIAHNGVQISEAQTVPGNRGWGLPPEDILTGDLLVRGNLFEDCVENGADAGGLKLWGATADRSSTFRDVLVVGNVSRRNHGYGWVSERRDNWTFHGQAGMGYYIDYAGGIAFFRNVAYANGLTAFMASGSWADQGVVLANNTFAGAPSAFSIGRTNPLGTTTHELGVVNNILIDHEEHVFGLGDERLLDGAVHIDSNLYHWNATLLAGHVDATGYRVLDTLADLQALGWESRGVDADPALAGYDPAVSDGTWQDFRLTAASTAAIDSGEALPASLAALLAKMDVADGAAGAALDRGAIEAGADLVIDVGPGDGTAPIVTPWDGEEPPPDVTPTGDEGCGCRAGSGAGAAPCGLGLLGLLGLGALRRRRASAPRS